MTLGQKIKKLRNDKNLTQKDFADQLHVTFQNYNCGEAIPDEVKKVAKIERVNEVQLINFGWIKSLEEFSIVEKEKNPYTLAALGKILDKKCAYFCSNFVQIYIKFIAGAIRKYMLQCL